MSSTCIVKKLTQSHLLAGLILVHSWYPNECCADKDCHPVPCDEISEDENGAIHWKYLIFEGSQIKSISRS